VKLSPLGNSRNPRWCTRWLPIIQKLLFYLIIELTGNVIRLLVISVKGFLGKDFVGHVGKGNI
jgi:hypothetical protein